MRILAGAAALMLAADGACAQGEAVPPGLMTMAAAQAPEAGTGVCFGADPEETVRCAIDKCAAESGLEREECRLSMACSPARWSADLFMQHQSGAHWHDYLCGWSTLPDLQAAIGVKCRGEGLTGCSAVSLWNPNGEEHIPSN